MTTTHLDDGLLAERACGLGLDGVHEAHIAACAECRAGLAVWQAVSRAVAPTAPALGASAPQPVGRRHRDWQRPVAAAACVAVLAAVGGLSWWRNDEDGKPVAVATTAVTSVGGGDLRTGFMATEAIVDNSVERTFTDYTTNVQLVQSGRALTIFRAEHFTYIEVPGILFERTGGKGYLRIPRLNPFRPVESVPTESVDELRRQGFTAKPLGSQATLWEKKGFGSLTVDTAGRVRQMAIRGFAVRNYDYEANRPLQVPSDAQVFDVPTFAAAKELLKPTLLEIPKP